MEVSRPRNRLAFALITAAFIVPLPIAYVTGYFLLGQRSAPPGNDNIHFRIFPAKWQCMIYAPAAKLESRLTGEIGVWYRTENNYPRHYATYVEERIAIWRDGPRE